MATKENGGTSPEKNQSANEKIDAAREAVASIFDNSPSPDPATLNSEAPKAKANPREAETLRDALRWPEGMTCEDVLRFWHPRSESTRSRAMEVLAIMNNQNAWLWLYQLHTYNEKQRQLVRVSLATMVWAIAVIESADHTVLRAASEAANARLDDFFRAAEAGELDGEGL